MRVGIGYDIHRLARGRNLVIGGARIPHSSGLAGHSDADVVCHAVIDALLGAAGLEDIGTHFPDTDPVYEGADSLGLLGSAVRLVRESGWAPVNVDVVVICEEPRIAPHREAMRARLATALQLDADQVALKGKTTEGLGFTGRREGIAAQAVALVERVS